MTEDQTRAYLRDSILSDINCMQFLTNAEMPQCTLSDPVESGRWRAVKYPASCNFILTIDEATRSRIIDPLCEFPPGSGPGQTVLSLLNADSRFPNWFEATLGHRHRSKSLRGDQAWRGRYELDCGHAVHGCTTKVLVASPDMV